MNTNIYKFFMISLLKSYIFLSFIFNEEIQLVFFYFFLKNLNYQSMTNMKKSHFQITFFHSFICIAFPITFFLRVFHSNEINGWNLCWYDQAPQEFSVSEFNGLWIIFNTFWIFVVICHSLNYLNYCMSQNMYYAIELFIIYVGYTYYKLLFRNPLCFL